MREKVLILAKEEGFSFDKSLLQRRFLHAISTGLRNNNIGNDLGSTLENNKISGEHLLQIVSEAVVNDSERHERLSKERKETKVNKIDNVDNSLLDEIRAMKLEHSTELAAFRAEILQIKEAVSSRNDFRRKCVRRCPNCTVTESNCSHCFVCGSSDHQKSVCPHYDKKKLAKVAQERRGATLSNKVCVCKKNVKILYKYTKCQSGKYCLKACQSKQYPEHKKHCAVISVLDSREKHKLEQFTVTDSEILPMKYRNQATN